jgi:hypothetical protein
LKYTDLSEFFSFTTETLLKPFGFTVFFELFILLLQITNEIYFED